MTLGNGTDASLGVETWAHVLLLLLPAAGDDPLTLCQICQLWAVARGTRD